jgi:hypothetical protein
MYRKSKRLKNRTKIFLAITAIAAVIAIPPACLFAKNKKLSEVKNTNINDSWTGEAYSGFRDLVSVKGKKYMISTSHEMASVAGKEILAKGGNAIDAVIAAQMVLNVVEPQSSGIGGGAFLLYYDAKTGQTHYYNGRETAPAKANSKIFLNEKGEARDFHDAVRGGLSVGSPGLLKVLKTTHEKYGKLEWEELFEPAIKIAANGFPMDSRITVITDNLHYLKDITNGSNTLENNKGEYSVGVAFDNDTIYLRYFKENPINSEILRIMIHELLHSYSYSKSRNLPEPISEGITDYIALQAMGFSEINTIRASGYPIEVQIILSLLEKIKKDDLIRVYFNGSEIEFKKLFTTNFPSINYSDFISQTKIIFNKTYHVNGVNRSFDKGLIDHEEVRVVRKFLGLPERKFEHEQY